MIVITMYLFTQDAENQETAMNILINFVALAVIVEIDTVLKGFSDVGYDDLELFDDMEYESTPDKFMRYVKF